MWVGVLKRFEQFHQNLLLTDKQIDDGITKAIGIRSCLNHNYYGGTPGFDNCFLIGSWAKETHVRPPRDIDIYFVLPASTYHSFSTNIGNQQSALLQDVKNVLLRTYPSTTMRGDGQVVVVNFSTTNIEVVPAFSQQNGRYLVCDTHDGGRYMETDPKSEFDFINSVDRSNANNLRPMIKILKSWQSHCSVPIKSIQLELIVAEFLSQSLWRLQSFYYFDWLIRDFFLFLYHKANGSVFVPGTNESIYLESAWQSRAESAYHRAVKACNYEKLDLVTMAGEEWQKIFGLQVPKLGVTGALLTSWPPSAYGKKNLASLHRQVFISGCVR